MTKPVTTQELFDMWQKMVNPSAYPLQTFMFPALDPKEVEKKIAELEIVEHWLKANVGMLQLSKQSLQYQLAMLKGGEKFQQEMASGGKGAKAAAAQPENPAMWAWKLMAEAGKSAMEGAANAPQPHLSKTVKEASQASSGGRARKSRK
jgi:hypothetical protein